LAFNISFSFLIWPSRSSNSLSSYFNFLTLPTHFSFKDVDVGSVTCSLSTLVASCIS
jgi:hypothetical protein